MFFANLGPGFALFASFVTLAVAVFTREAVTDWATAVIGIVTLGLLLRFRIREPWIVLADGLLGLLLHLPH